MDYDEYRVRVTGFVYTSSSYGHLNAADALLVATRITYLDTPGCTPPG